MIDKQLIKPGFTFIKDGDGCFCEIKRYDGNGVWCVKCSEYELDEDGEIVRDDTGNEQIKELGEIELTTYDIQHDAIL